jgi:hypothetical protein
VRPVRLVGPTLSVMIVGYAVWLLIYAVASWPWT